MGFLRICFLLFWYFNYVSAQPITDPKEAAALSKIIELWNLRNKLNISGDPCRQNASWAEENANPRVSCDCTPTTCHIKHLKVYALDVSGEIPVELFDLKELMDLNLGQNVLGGPIPVQIGLLSNMQYLSLGINNLTGTLPPELGNLTKLISLSLSSNNFNGALPPELGKLTSLNQLYIDSSGVSGPVPEDLANLKSLEILWASDNQFTGKFPDFIATLTELRDLRIQGTSLEGPLPASLTNLNKLDNLRIGDLGGEDSSLDFLKNQTSLSILILRNCRIAGQIPDEIGAFTKLQLLDLSFNKLTGPIPATFQNFPELQYLYLGSNSLNGEIPGNIINPTLVSLDVSFNSLSGKLPLNFGKVGLSMNLVGTSINSNGILESEASGLLECVRQDSKCSSNTLSSTAFAIKCGGSSIKTSASSDVEFEDESEVLGSASLYTSSNNLWAVSNIGNFISNPNGQVYTARTESQIIGTLESELYRTARISASSLRYYGLGMENGKYKVELHFAEIQMGDSYSWRGLGRRFFDVYIQVDDEQGERVLKDFNIQAEAGGSKRGLAMSFAANVSNSVMDIHLFWAGKGTCCIPYQSTYGPLVSAIRVSPVSADRAGYQKRDKKRAGRIAGVAVGCAAAAVIMASAFYLWWTKDPQTHIQIQHSDSLRKY
ncbi:Probable LRR receptor-like serine/threonine-protein kinase At1g56140 [Linum perenne]